MTKEKYILRRAPLAVPTLPVLSANVLPSPLFPKSQRNHPPYWRIPEESTAAEASTSPNISLAARTRGIFQSHILAIAFHMTRVWPAHSRHLATWWDVD